MMRRNIATNARACARSLSAGGGLSIVACRNAQAEGIPFMEAIRMKPATNMTLHLRYRTIRPSTRKPESTYRVTVEGASPNDLVVIFIDHEREDFREIFHCRGRAFRNKSASVNFKWVENRVEWMGEISPTKAPKSIDLDCAD